MTGRRTRGMSGADLSGTAVGPAVRIAKLLRLESSALLELYRKRENFEADVGNDRLVSIPPSSSQLDRRDKLWRLQSALEQCQSLLERAIAKEEEELDGPEKGEYENKRKVVKGRLSHLLSKIRQLLKTAGGPAFLTPGLDASKLDAPATLFKLKMWIYQIFTEVEYWSKTAVTILEELRSDAAKEPAARRRSSRSARR